MTSSDHRVFQGIRVKRFVPRRLTAAQTIPGFAITKQPLFVPQQVLPDPDAIRDVSLRQLSGILMRKLPRSVRPRIVPSSC